MRFVKFTICDADGKPVQRQHPEVYIGAKTITRVVKVPDKNDITYLDLGASGVYVRGNYDEIAAVLNQPSTNPVEVLWPNLQEQ